MKAIAEKSSLFSNHRNSRVNRSRSDIKDSPYFSYDGIVIFVRALKMFLKRRHR